MELSTNLKKAILLIGDILLVIFSYSFSYYLRVGFPECLDYTDIFIYTLPFILVLKIYLFTRMGLYKAIWRYAGTESFISIFKASATSTLGFIFIIFIARVNDIPRSIPIIDWMITFILLAGGRFSIRFIREYFHVSNEGKKVILYGAGDAGCVILREMYQNPKTPYHPVGFIDDDPGKKGRTINNLTVLGDLDNLEDIVATLKPEEVIITMPSISREKAKQITEKCRQLGVPAKTLPMISELIEGKVNLNLIRKIDITDLLRRSPKSLDPEKIGSLIRESRILITGAGGSIGSEIARQCVKYKASKVYLLDSSEFSLYMIHHELSNISDCKTQIIPLLDDLKSTQNLEFIFKAHKPEVVFHAAAYKHVPMVEFNPHSAITNNVLSTRNIVRISDREKVKKFVMISTDKAVRPTSLMGASKRICELYVQNFNKKSKTEFITVRFGNVLGSSGSVVPLFKEQILKGGPVTVTHPEMVRFFMLIPEAVQLVLQAGALGRGGEIFILDMGDPVKIADMARDLIYLMGFVPDEDIKIEFTGLRPGEKLYEELLTDESELQTQYEDILIGRVESVDLDKLEKDLEELLEYAAGSRISPLIKKVKDLVSDFQPQNKEYAQML